MAAIMESIFDAAYLIAALTFGVLILRRAEGRKQYLLFGVMTIILACGDAFHLLPRIWALNNGGTETFAAALGFGTLVTSVTMTVFYVILYHVWRLRYDVQGKRGLTTAIYVIAAVRIALCLFPQNNWMSPDSPLSWGIYRNIPFAILGIVMIVLFFKTRGDRIFKFMWLAIALSFAFYAPVVLFADAVPAVGMLMLPKTCAYVWMLWMGYSGVKERNPPPE
jgi:hypothetical protein